MNAWFQSPEFAAKENASQPLLTSLQTSLGKPVKLNDFWNVFDDLNTQQDAILVGGNGALTSVMQERTWSQVGDYSHQLFLLFVYVPECDVCLKVKIMGRLSFRNLALLQCRSLLGGSLVV
jgi:hypothetical protein